MPTTFGDLSKVEVQKMAIDKNYSKLEPKEKIREANEEEAQE